MAIRTTDGGRAILIESAPVTLRQYQAYDYCDYCNLATGLPNEALNLKMFKSLWPAADENHVILIATSKTKYDTK